MELEQLREYRWRVREREALLRQMEELNSEWFERPDPRGRAAFMRSREARKARCEARLREEEARLSADMEVFERMMETIRHPRTRLVIRQYYGLGMTDQQIGEADGFSARTAGSIRHAWLREQEGGETR